MQSIRESQSTNEERKTELSPASPPHLSVKVRDENRKVQGKRMEEKKKKTEREATHGILIIVYNIPILVPISLGSLTATIHGVIKLTNAPEKNP